MILRSLLLLGVGAAIACATPVFAAGTTAAETTETTMAATVQVAANTEKKVIKKKTRTAKKKTGKKKPAETEEAKEEKSRNLFSTLFGGGIKEKDDKDDVKAKAKPAKAATKVKKSKPEPEEEPITVSITSNKGELRSETREPPGLFDALFGGKKMSMLPETRALDRALEQKQARRQFKVKPALEPQEVEFTGYSPGTIVIDTSARYLYLVEGRSTARRYAIAVGREGLQFKGNVTVGDKQEWPRWIPTKEMQQREPRKYGQYKDGMDGGPDNPLGARAIYLYQGRKDTYLRIHGTNQPQTIGTSASNGCFRMINDHVMDLYRRVKIGTSVVVL